MSLLPGEYKERSGRHVVLEAVLERESQEQMIHRSSSVIVLDSAALIITNLAASTRPQWHLW